MVEPLERVAPALEDRRALERLDAAGDDPKRLAAGVVVDRPDRGQRRVVGERGVLLGQEQLVAVGLGGVRIQ